MLLEENKVYNNAEMAEWFQVKTETFKHSKAKKLQYLENFAEFEQVGGKIKIIKVYCAEYISPRNKKENDKRYQKDIIEVLKENPLQYKKTCAYRVQKLEHGSTEILNHKFSTAYHYVCQNLTEVADKDKNVWCQRLFEAEVDFIPLEGQAYDFWKELIHKNMNSEDVAEAQSLYVNGEIDLKEYQDKTKKAIRIGFENITTQFEEAYGFVPVAVPLWKINSCKI